jgi:hypothetical protein
MQEISTFTRDELQVLEDFQRILELSASAMAPVVQRRREDLELLAAIVSRSPSPTRDLFNGSTKRDLDSLTRKMVNQGLDQVVNLPAKAVLGHGFTVSKLHLFGMLGKIAGSETTLADYRHEVEEMYTDILFTLMAEDLYSSILTNSEESDPWVKQASRELVGMWDYRTSPNKETFAPFIRDLWKARRTLVPVLGTLLGTMELMRLSSSLPPVWLSYLALPDEDLSMNYALEEFLFDLSYEQISQLRAYMSQNKIAAVNRESAAEILVHLEASATPEEHVREHPAESMGVQLYHSFLVRQRNARMRRCRRHPGPVKTLEEYFVTYLLTMEST